MASTRVQDAKCTDKDEIHGPSSTIDVRSARDQPRDIETTVVAPSLMDDVVSGFDEIVLESKPGIAENVDSTKDRAVVPECVDEARAAPTTMKSLVAKLLPAIFKKTKPIDPESDHRAESLAGTQNPIDEGKIGIAADTVVQADVVSESTDEASAPITASTSVLVEEKDNATKTNKNKSRVKKVWTCVFKKKTANSEVKEKK